MEPPAAGTQPPPMGGADRSGVGGRIGGSVLEHRPDTLHRVEHLLVERSVEVREHARATSGEGVT